MKDAYLIHCLCIGIMVVCGDTTDNVYFNTFLARSTSPQGQNSDVTLLWTFLKFSVEDCVSKCKHLRKCSYINYYSRSNTCELIASTADNMTVTIQPGVIFGKKLDWDMTALDTCTSCNDNETCIPEVPGCKIDGCGSPVVSSGTVVVGNDFKVEARLKYACATGYSNNGSSLITCESNGQWSSLDACTQDASQCPLTTNYQTIKLSDHTNFKYWLVRGTSLYTQAEGAALCQTCQGKLVEILTTAKLTFLRYILTMQAEDIDYWIDGSNADAANFSSHDSWTTASGSIIPFDIGLWAPGKPDLLDVQHCIRLRPSSGYYFDNKACGVLYRVICEQ